MGNPIFLFGIIIIFFSYCYLGDDMNFKIGDYVTRNSYDNELSK